MALTKFNFNSFDVTSAASKGLGFNASANGFSTIEPGAMTLIKTLTASSDSTLSFVHGSSDVVLDNTYPVYMFKFINIHPGTDDYDFKFNLSVDTGSNYNVTKTNHAFRASHEEGGGSASLDNASSPDLAQSTGVQAISGLTIGGDNDQSCSGEVRLFNPSGTTFIKHYNVITQTYSANGDASTQCFVAGYGNTTSAINAIQFKMSYW